MDSTNNPRNNSETTNQSCLDTRVSSDKKDEQSSLELHKQSDDASRDLIQGAKDPEMQGESGKDLEKAESSKEPAYTTFTQPQKIAIVAMATLSSFFSPLSSSIYFPALNTMATYYDVSPSLINITITMYQIFQGLAPTFYGDFADQAGRRPAFLIAFIIYIAANIGLATQSSYAALMVLRCLQSSGSSGTIALSLGVIADVTVSSERGTYMGFAISGTILAMAIGPIIGGLLTEFLGWRSIFWFLAIFGASFLLAYVSFMPETSRKVVGNGSILPESWWNKSFWNVSQGWKLRKNESQEARKAREEAPRRKLRWPQPWKSLQVMKEKDVVIVLFFNSIVTAAFYDIVATIPLLFKDIYGFNSIQIGLCYIPMGVGCFIFTLLNGRLIDWNFRRHAKIHNIPISKTKATDLRNFPIEYARLQTLAPTYIPGLAAVCCYGWALSCSPPLAVPLVLQFIIGGCMVSASNTGSTLLVDLYPESPAMVSATNNMARCLIGAVATAVVQPMIEGMGLGGCYTLVAGVGIFAVPMAVVLVKRGPRWREQRRIRIEGATKAASV